MAVFVAASDESSGRTPKDPFYFAGWVGLEEDWSRFFIPAWQERVLDGPPSIPYLHMTEIRSPEWRSKYGLTRLQAEDRVDAAFTLLDTMATLYPVGIHVNAGLFRDKFADSKVVAPKRKGRPFDPDYLCFLGYAFHILEYIAHEYPDAEKVDFIVERNGVIPRYIQEFHSQIPNCLRALGDPSLAELVGELIPGDKTRVPLQAADVLCWHTARPAESMGIEDRRRYAKFAHRRGLLAELTKEEMDVLHAAIFP